MFLVDLVLFCNSLRCISFSPKGNGRRILNIFHFFLIFYTACNRYFSVSFSACGEKSLLDPDNSLFSVT